MDEEARVLLETAVDEIERLQGTIAHEERVKELERDRDTLLKFYAGGVPEALDQLHGEERNRIYRMLRLEITPRPDGILNMRGIQSDSLRVRYENGNMAHDFVPTERYLSLG